MTKKKRKGKPMPGWLKAYLKKHGHFPPAGYKPRKGGKKRSKSKRSHRSHASHKKAKRRGSRRGSNKPRRSHRAQTMRFG